MAELTGTGTGTGPVAEDHLRTVFTLKSSKAAVADLAFLIHQRLVRTGVIG
jgi:hypothetical protein